MSLRPSTLRKLFLGVIAVLALSATPAQAVEGGVVVSHPTEAGSGEETNTLRDLSDLGAKWTRVFVSWADMEMSPGVLNVDGVEYLDRFLRTTKARGMNTIFVVTETPSWVSGGGPRQSPPNAAKYADFLKRLAARLGPGRVGAWEIWNEPDLAAFWAGAPDAPAYSTLLKTVYPVIKKADPTAAVLVGGLTGGNYAFVQELYDNGAKGSFDGVGVHTDTGCNTTSPETFYREGEDPRYNGWVGRYSFTGYREVRHVMLANGDDKPIWMTELGWSTTTKICEEGSSAGKKPGGVSEADQALFIQRAFNCLEDDPYVKVAVVFALRDFTAQDTMHHRYGLTRSEKNFPRKPAFGTTANIFRNGSGLGGACGGIPDHTPPAVSLGKPTVNQEFIDRFTMSATATDAETKVVKVEFWVDGKLVKSAGPPPATLDWFGARSLALGKHEVLAKAYDEGGNVGVSTTTVTKVKTFSGPQAKTKIAARLSGKGRRWTVKVSVAARGATAAGAKLSGRVRVSFQSFDKRKGRFLTRHRYLRGVSKKVAVTRSLRAGKWRVRLDYPGGPGFAPSKRVTREFRVR